MYIVVIYENFHDYEDDQEDESGKFATADEAIAAAKAIIDKSLRWERSSRPVGLMTGAELFDHWQDFGDSPSIRATDGSPRVEFSASVFAKERAEEMCQDKRIDP